MILTSPVFLESSQIFPYNTMGHPKILLQMLFLAKTKNHVSDLGRLQKGPLDDAIDFLNAAHGQMVRQTEELVGEGIWQSAHHGAHHLAKPTSCCSLMLGLFTVSSQVTYFQAFKKLHHCLWQTKLMFIVLISLIECVWIVIIHVCLLNLLTDQKKHWSKL